MRADAAGKDAAAWRHGEPRAGLAALFDEYLASVDRDRAAADFAAAAGLGRDEARRTLDNYLEEAAFGLRLIGDELSPGARILEIGAGAGLVFSFLRAQGFDAFGLEPAASGFEFMGALSRVVAGGSMEVARAHLFEIPAADLDPERHGAFDLIFSVNVIEHVADLPAAFAAMARVLAPGGLMIHHCPNYAVPYEPHFGAPLVPFFPRATAALFPKRIAARQALWESLNFVTAAEIRRLARSEKLSVEFASGTLAASLRRLRRDPEFAARHAFARSLDFLAPLVALVPPDLATPMTARFREAPASGRHPAR